MLYLLECDSAKFEVSTAFSNYPNRAYYEELKQNPVILKHFNNDSSSITYDQLKSKVVAINVFYEDLSYTLVKEIEQTSLISLISNMGKYIEYL